MKVKTKIWATVGGFVLIVIVIPSGIGLFARWYSPPKEQPLPSDEKMAAVYDEVRKLREKKLDELRNQGVIFRLDHEPEPKIWVLRSWFIKMDKNQREDIFLGIWLDVCFKDPDCTLIIMDQEKNRPLVFYNDDTRPLYLPKNE